MSNNSTTSFDSTANSGDNMAQVDINAADVKAELTIDAEEFGIEVMMLCDELGIDYDSHTEAIEELKSENFAAFDRLRINMGHTPVEAKQVTVDTKTGLVMVESDL